jgi:hypothetical protein
MTSNDASVRFSLFDFPFPLYIFCCQANCSVWLMPCRRQRREPGRPFRMNPSLLPDAPRVDRWIERPFAFSQGMDWALSGSQRPLTGGSGGAVTKGGKRGAAAPFLWPRGPSDPHSNGPPPLPNNNKVLSHRPIDSPPNAIWTYLTRSNAFRDD